MMVDAPTDLALPEIKANPQQLQNKLQRTFNTMGAVGFGSGVGGGLGTGTGGGMGGIGLPPSYRDRCSASNRTSRLRSSGGRISSERAVQDALAWLKLQQNADGSFGENYPVGMTGLAVLAYLGHCETPESALYGRTVERALEYLVSRVGRGPKGLTASSGGHGDSYEHGIATYALGEAYIMTGDPEYREPFVRGIRRIIDAQTEGGGWLYSMNGQPEEGVLFDTSISGWQIQALKSAYLASLNEVEGIEESLDRAAKGMRRMYNDEKRIFRYRRPDDDGGHLVGVGVFTLAMWKHMESPEAQAGIQVLLDRLEDEDWRTENGELIYGKANLYGLYYDTQAMFAAGGKEWRALNRWFQKSVSEAQSEDGSWPRTEAYTGHGGGVSEGGHERDFAIYRTAVCTLMLEVYYRFLPVVDF